MRKKEFFYVGIIIIACVLIILFIYPKFASIGTDGVYYALMGKSLAEGHGLTVFNKTEIYFSPLFPYCIVPFYWLFKNIDLAAHLTIIFFGLASLPLFYYALHLIANKNIALIGTFFLAFNGRWLESNSVVPLAQPLVGFLTIVFLLFLIKYVQQKEKNYLHSFIYCMLLGAIGGSLYLTRPEYIFLIIPLLIFIWFVNKKNFSYKENFYSIILTFLGFCLVALPYISFLKSQTGQWIFTGRLYEQYLATMQLPIEISPNSLTGIVLSSLPRNPILMLLQDFPALLKLYFKNLLVLEQRFSATLGIIGISFFGYGIINFIFKKRFKELFAIIISAIALLFLPLGHTGDKGYLVPFLYFFIIFISIGCWEFTFKLADKFNFSIAKRRLFLIIIIILISFYFFFPIPKNYFFNKNYKPVEYLMLGDWFKNNVSDFENKVILSRKPEIAFYAESGWQGISGKENLQQLIDLMKKQNWQYLALDTRSLKDDVSRLITLYNQEKNFSELKLLKEIGYNNEKIYLYKLD